MFYPNQMDEDLRQFGRFLKDENCFEAYMSNRNFSISHGSSEEFFANTPKIAWIVSAFKWSITPEGYNFWSKIDSKWMRIIETGRMRVPDNKLV